MNEMAKHVRILGTLYIIFSVLGMLVGIILYVGLTASGAFSGDIETMKILEIIAIAIGGLFLIVSLPGLIGGIGLLNHQQWAKILVLIIGILNLLNFPFGTVLGVYTIWVLMNNQTDKIFESKSSNARLQR
ncbi:MAG: hypothetical protein ACOCXH_16465 [Cyclobacteriaceae bacterium]